MPQDLIVAAITLEVVLAGKSLHSIVTALTFYGVVAVGPDEGVVIRTTGENAR
jgi:hypothetical protein